MIVYTSRGTLDLGDPQPDHIQIEDIAEGLARRVRWGCAGYTRYTVASHSLMVADMVEAGAHPPDVVAAALLHDAFEAYAGDVPAPLKNALPEYRKAEDRFLGTLMYRWNTADARGSSAIRCADAYARAIEERDILRKSGPWSRYWRCESYLQEDPRVAFLRRAEALGLC